MKSLNSNSGRLSILSMQLRFTRITLRILVLAILLLCFFHSDAQAQGHTIRGKVRNSSGVNLPRITVSLETGNGALINQTVTNNEGDFYFSGLDETSYLITISAPDYDPASERVEFVRNVSADEPGETRTVEITLPGKGGVRPPRAGLNFVQEVPRAARDAFESAIKLLRDKRPLEAIAAFDTALRLFPDYFDARFVLANEMAIQGRFDEAITHLDKARKINPRDDRVFDLFARIMMQQRKYAVAARIFAEAARLNPLEPQYMVSRAAALIDQAATIDPTKSQANLDERNFALSEAEKALNHAYQLSNKKLPEIHLQRARLYEKKGERARAADELEQYLRKTPDARNANAIREAIKTLRGQE